MMRITFQPQDWYWKIGANGAIYSSASNTYVDATDATYIAWLAKGLAPAPVESEAEIWSYIQPFRPAWLFNGTTFSQPTATSYTKAQLKAYSAGARYNKEVGGTTVNGTAIATDRESQGMIERAYSMATKDSTFTTRWKGADGSFGPTLNAATIIAIGTAVGQHVAACFAAEANVADQIDSGAIISLPLIDQAYAAIA